MKLISILFTILMITLAGAACSEPAAQTQAEATAASPETYNPADLLPKGATPVDGVLTGGQPNQAQLEALAELGYTTVVNMRGPNEQGSTDPAAVEALGMTYVSIPITGATDVNEANARRLSEILEDSDGPVVVHCASSNRVGALFALKAFYVDEASPEDALAMGKETGLTRLEPVVRQQLSLE